MSELRSMMLTKSYAEMGILPSDEFPMVYGVMMDWPIDENAVSVVSLCDGNASLYTTSSFGLIGGVGHESVRDAAKEFVHTAAKYFDVSVPTKDYPYPDSGSIKFYLLTFEGIRVLKAEEAALASGEHFLSDLGDAAQKVIAELHRTSDGGQDSCR